MLSFPFYRSGNDTEKKLAPGDTAIKKKMHESRQAGSTATLSAFLYRVSQCTWNSWGDLILDSIVQTIAFTFDFKSLRDADKGHLFDSSSPRLSEVKQFG